MTRRRYPYSRTVREGRFLREVGVDWKAVVDDLREIERATTSDMEQRQTIAAAIRRVTFQGFLKATIAAAKEFAER